MAELEPAGCFAKGKWQVRRFGLCGWFWVTLAGVCWLSAGVLALSVEPGGDRLRWLLVALSASAAATVIAALALMARPPQSAYELGYRVGWDEGRAAERKLGRRPATVSPIRRSPKGLLEFNRQTQQR